MNGHDHISQRPSLGKTQHCSFAMTATTAETIRQVCRIRKHQTGATINQTLGDVFSGILAGILADILAEDPSLAIIARGNGPRSQPRESIPPPKRRPARSTNEW